MTGRGRRAKKEEQLPSAGDASPPLTRNRAARSGVTLSFNAGGDISRSPPDPLLRPPIKGLAEDSFNHGDVLDTSDPWRSQTPETKVEIQRHSEVRTTVSHSPFKVKASENKFWRKDVQGSGDRHRTPKDVYEEDNDETEKDDTEDSDGEEEDKMAQKDTEQSSDEDEGDETEKEIQPGVRKISQSPGKVKSETSYVKTWQDPAAMPSTYMGRRNPSHPNHVKASFDYQKKQTSIGDLLSSDDEVETPPAKNRKTQSVGAASADSNAQLCVGWSKLMMLLPLLLFLLSAVWWRAVYFQSQIKMSKENRALQNFQTHMEELKPLYPNQEEPLWDRSKKILGKHLNSSHHTQPVILLLTATPKGEVALRCLSESIARIYASSLNTTMVSIDGTSKVTVESDRAKLEVDEELSTKFNAGSKAGVIHRIEQLPAGSMLIFYKYCDHENAAFKDVALVLTVLLEDEVLTPGMPLKEVEETVRDFISTKFTAPSRSTTYKDMDGDKLSGLWSRISHVVLPVHPEDAPSGNSC